MIHTGMDTGIEQMVLDIRGKDTRRPALTSKTYYYVACPNKFVSRARARPLELRQRRSLAKTFDSFVRCMYENICRSRSRYGPGSQVQRSFA